MTPMKKIFTRIARLGIFSAVDVGLATLAASPASFSYNSWAGWPR